MRASEISWYPKIIVVKDNMKDNEFAFFYNIGFVQLLAAILQLL